MKYDNVPILSVSSAANSTGAGIDASQMIKMSVQVVATGSAAGTLQLQVSNDPNPNGPMSTSFRYTNWSNLGTATTVSTAGVQLVAIQDMGYRAIRAVWTGSGVGTIVVNIMALCL